MSQLTKIKGFFPYVAIIFFNAFTDLGHKVLLQNTLYINSGSLEYTILSAILNGLILIPYILLFTPSGFLSDKFAKASILRWTAAAAIPITLLVTLCYYMGWFWLAFAGTLLLAIQSAVNSPAKYGYIKEIFGKENIASANGVVQGIAIISILAGTFIFTLLFSHYVDASTWGSAAESTKLSLTLQSFAPLGFLLVISSVVETILTFKLPKTVAADPNSTYVIKKYFSAEYLKGHLSTIKRADSIIFISIVALAVFWGINQVLLATYGAYLKEHVLLATPIFAQGSLALGGVGIFVGALYAGKVSRGFIETGIIPIAAIGMTVGLFLLSFLHNETAISVVLFLYGFCGGMIIVPLNSLIQFQAKHNQLGKVLATKNFVSNAVMIIFLAITAIAASIKIDSSHTIQAMFVIALIGSIYALIKLPQSLVRYIVFFVLTKFYRIDVSGLNNIPSSGGVLILGNHSSLLDWAILQISCPRHMRFVMARSIYEKWYLNIFLKHFGIIPISKSASKALEEIKSALNEGEVVALFPEGHLSRNGQMGEFKKGFEVAAKETDTAIIPFYIRGLWGTISSYADQHYKRASKILTRNVSVHYGEVLPSDTSAQKVKQAVTHLSISAWKDYSQQLGNIQQQWLMRAKQLSNEISVADSMGTSLSHHKLIAAVMFFTKKVKQKMRQQQNIGIILPPSCPGAIANLAVLCAGKTIVNLNYTMGIDNIKFAIEKANIKTIITSKKFVSKLKQKNFDLDEILNATTPFYLENYKQTTTKLSILTNYLLVKLTPFFILKRLLLTKSNVENTAAILFSSGSEGQPKGVELSHRNLLGNVKQMASVLNVDDSDAMLSNLPLFHAFGLTVTLLLPLIEGGRFICHPDPTDTTKIAKLIFEHSITIMCGTSTFFGMYIRNPKIHPLMLQSLRLCIAGAEKLSPQVYKHFKEKFGVEIFEGYGTTEVSPVASTNLPDALSPDDFHVQVSNKAGTVGLPLPGSAYKIVDPESLKELPQGEDGLILIGGTQVMKGYLQNKEKTNDALIHEPEITWYKTGDKGHLDQDGFLVIVDRYSRFAKVGGEMISLTTVENQIRALLANSEIEIMVTAIPDEKKGEKLILLHTENISSDDLKAQVLSSSIENIMKPANYISIKEIPKLASGKANFSEGKKIAQRMPKS